MKEKMKLIFVYNANSSPINQAIDFFYKIASPATYQCNLRKLTYDSFNEKQEWSDFIKSLSIESKFYHKDMFQKRFPSYSTNHPVVLLQINDNLQTFISSELLNGLTSLAELKKIVLEKVSMIQ